MQSLFFTSNNGLAQGLLDGLISSPFSSLLTSSWMICWLLVIFCMHVGILVQNQPYQPYELLLLPFLSQDQMLQKFRRTRLLTYQTSLSHFYLILQFLNRTYMKYYYFFIQVQLEQTWYRKNQCDHFGINST